MDLFYGISDDNLKTLKDCLRAIKKTYLKDEIIYNYEDKFSSVGYILKGKVQVLKDDYEKHRVIIANQKEHETFAEAYVCLGIKESPVIVKAVEDTDILFIDFNRILSVCSNSCPFHRKLIENIIQILSKKILYLNSRVELLSKKSLRDRITEYLIVQKQINPKIIFDIPFSREDMAHYLGVNRSALSRELSKMKDEKLIDYHKNSFKLKF